MADLLDNLTNATGMTPAQYGVGPVWPNGVEHSSIPSIATDFIRTADTKLEPTANNKNRLYEIHKRFHAATYEGAALNYIISGDSTRDNPKNGFVHISQEHYIFLFEKVSSNITVDFDSVGGMTSANWLANTSGSSGITNCTSLISGTGLNSIVEYSFFINDYLTSPVFATIKADAIASINALLAAKPDVAIVLVDTVKSAFPDRNATGIQIYKELGEELNLPVVSAFNMTELVRDNIDYYSGNSYPPVLNDTHPNEHGIKRLVDGIVRSVLPEHIRPATAEVEQGGNVVHTAVVQGQYWNTGAGAPPVVDANAVCFEEFSVPTDTNVLICEHLGNMDDIAFMDVNKTYIRRGFRASTVGALKYVVYPAGTVYIRANIDNSGALTLTGQEKIYITYMSLSDRVLGLIFPVERTL